MTDFFLVPYKYKNYLEEEDCHSDLQSIKSEEILEGPEQDKNSELDRNDEVFNTE